VLPQHQALFYVAALLAQPPAEPLHPLPFAQRVLDLYGVHPDFPYGMDSIRTLPQENQRTAILNLHIDALEAIIHNPAEIETYKQEPITEALRLYSLADQPGSRPAQTPESTGDDILAGLLHLYNQLALATDPRGNPRRVPRAFAIHLLCYLIIPTPASSALLTQLSALTSQPSIARITYTGGYVMPGTAPGPGQTPLPDDLEQAAVEQVAFWFQKRDKLGLRTTWPSSGEYKQFADLDLLRSVSTTLAQHSGLTL